VTDVKYTQVSKKGGGEAGDGKDIYFYFVHHFAGLNNTIITTTTATLY
jgi:hypothetical protein